MVASRVLNKVNIYSSLLVIGILVAILISTTVIPQLPAHG